MSYDCSDFVQDVTNAADRLMTKAERRRVEQADDPAPAADALFRILRAIPTPKPVKRAKQPYHEGDAERVGIALAELRQALHELRLAGANKTAARVRLAISSAKGAVRNAEYRRTKSRGEA